MSRLAHLRPVTALILAIAFYFFSPNRATAQAARSSPYQQPPGSARDLVQQEDALRQAARKTPSNPRVLAQLGAVLAMQNKMDEAVTWLEKALKLNPGDVNSRRMLATTYWQLGQLEKARQNLESALRAKVQDDWSTLLLGMISEELGDHAKAVQLLSSVLPRVRQRPEPVLALARAYYHVKQPDKARETLRYLNDSSDNTKALFEAGRAAAEFHDYPTAENFFRSILYTYPNPGEIQFNLALAQYSQKKYEDSEKTLLASVQAGRADANAYDLLGWTYQQQNKLDDMMKAFEAAINMDPSQESHFQELSQALLEKRINETALEVAKEAIKRFPQSSQAYCLKGAAELSTSRLTDALQSYGRAIELDAKNPRAALGLALTYWNASQTTQAAAAFADAARKFPNEALILLKYAIFLMNSAEQSTAQRDAQIRALLISAEQLDNSMSETHFHLGNIAVKENKYEEALREFSEAAKLDPEMSKVHFALARVYRRLGREDEAVRETELHQKLKAIEDQNSEANAGIGTRHP